jgi:hypothetical protein
MADFACHARDAHGRQCRHPAWGLTCYCHWHNAALYWRMMRMMTQAQRRSAGWVYYDPGLVTTWEPPRLFGTVFVIIWLFALPLGAVGRWLFNIPPPAGTTPFDLVVNSLAFAVLLPAVAMTAGNSSRRLAQVLLAACVLLLGVTAYRWFGPDAGGWSLKMLAPLAFATGMLLLALPPPRGPMGNLHVDVTDPTVLPPLNLGSSAVRGVGWILLVSSGVCSALFGNFTMPWAKPPDAPAVQPADPPPPTDPAPEPPAAPHPTPPAPEGWTHNPLTAAGLAFFVGMVFSNLGSFRSIRSEWHHQTIYHRCVMPAVGRVTMPPQLLGTLAGWGTFYVLTRFVLTPDWVGLVAGGGLAAAIAFFGAWRRGVRIYTENVRQHTGGGHFPPAGGAFPS